jgi:hypothetical protein
MKTLKSSQSPIHKQADLFGVIPKPKTRIKLTHFQKEKQSEKKEAHTAFKLLKSRTNFPLSDRQKLLLKIYYNISIS